MPAWRWTLRVALFGSGATLLIVFVDPIRLAYESPSLHIAFDTAAASIALFAAYLVVGRFRQGRELDVLFLACGLAMLGAVNLLFGALPAALDQELGTASSWMRAAGRLLAALLLVAAAWAPSTRTRSPNVHRLAFLSTASVLAALWLVLAFMGDRLPVALDPTLSPEASSRALLVGHPVVHAIQLLAVALYGAAAIGFLRKPDRDELTRWIAPACVLASFASVQYFMFPSLYSEWFYTGDVFRLAFYLLLVVGVASDIWRYQLDGRRLAVLEERRRIARDLHDGLAQELNYIVGATETAVSQMPTSARLLQISAAAERALDESRRAIAALTRPEDESLDAALAQAASEVANRVGAKLVLDLDPTVEVTAAAREQLVRIVREAVTNAARHGHAGYVRVTLANGDGISLIVTDDGEGFDPRLEHETGFGLVSMRERARAIGGELSVRSRLAAGTEVVLLLPEGAAR